METVVKKPKWWCQRSAYVNFCGGEEKKRFWEGGEGLDYMPEDPAHYESIFPGNQGNAWEMGELECNMSKYEGDGAAEGDDLLGVPATG